MNIIYMALAALLLTGPTIQAQRSPDRWSYTAGCEVTGTSLNCSVSVPSDSTRKVRLISAVVVCLAAACDYTIFRDGTTPTATAGTITKNRSVAPTPLSRWWTASNSTGGTSLPGAISLPFATALPLDLADIDILAGENVRFSLSTSTSQKLQIFAKWEEF